MALWLFASAEKREVPSRHPHFLCCSVRMSRTCLRCQAVGGLCSHHFAAACGVVWPKRMPRPKASGSLAVVDVMEEEVQMRAEHGERVVDPLDLDAEVNEVVCDSSDAPERIADAHDLHISDERRYFIQGRILRYDFKAEPGARSFDQEALSCHGVSFDAICCGL